MNTAQLCDQRLRPAQETGNKKAEPLLSIQQTPIDHPMDVMIDSSGLVMDNGISPVGFIADIFTRLTRRVVFEFLGGHARMEELPCLGDLVDGNDEFHRITPSPTFSKSSQFKLLDSTGNLHLSSIVFIDSDFNPRMVDYLYESVLLDSYDASSTTFISSLENFRPKLISQSADHTIEESHQCSPIDSLLLPKTVSGLMAESLCDSEVSESQIFTESDGTDFMSAPIPISSNHSEKENSENTASKMAYPKDGPNVFGRVKGVPSEIYNSSVSASNGQIQKTLALLAPNLLSFMFENQHGSVPIEQAVQTSNSSTSDCDSVSSMDCIDLAHPCNVTFGYSNKSATISTDESFSKFLIPDPKHLNEFLYGNLEFPMFLASERPDEKLDTFDYPSLHVDSDPVDDKDVADLSDSEWNDQLNNRKYYKKTSDTSGVLIGLENGSSSGECNEMEISDSSNTELLATHWPTGVDSSSFDVSDHEELLESYGLYNQDQKTDVGYTCSSPNWPGKVDAAWKEAIQMNLTDLDTNENSLGSFPKEHLKYSVSSTHLERRERTFNTSFLDNSSEDYSSQGHLSDDGFGNSMAAPISGTTENPLVYLIPNPDILEDFLFGSLNSPTFLAQDKEVDIIDSSFGACYSDDCSSVASSSNNFNMELLDELLESYGLNEQDQYNDDFICESPTWPGKA